MFNIDLLPDERDGWKTWVPRITFESSEDQIGFAQMAQHDGITQEELINRFMRWEVYLRESEPQS